MEVFRVPMREVRVRILMDNGQTFDGVVYAPAEGPDGRPGRVLDRLNGEGEGFIPLACDDDHLLLNKSGIVSVQVPRGQQEAASLDEEPGRKVPIRITLVGGTSLVGRIAIQMPPDRSRVLDYLNAAPRFVPVLGEDHVTLVHRSYMLCVRTLKEEEGEQVAG